STPCPLTCSKPTHRASNKSGIQQNKLSNYIISWALLILLAASESCVAKSGILSNIKVSEAFIRLFTTSGSRYPLNLPLAAYRVLMLSGSRKEEDLRSLSTSEINSRMACADSESSSSSFETASSSLLLCSDIAADNNFSSCSSVTFRSPESVTVQVSGIS